MGSVWIGVDLGTTGVRVLAVSDHGRVLGRGQRPLDGQRDGGRHEQDPEAWWEAAGRACREALGELAPGRVRGVACCATSGTILVTDGDGEPLTPGLMYDDSRAADQARRIGGSPAAPLAKLVWLLERHGELASAGRLAHQPDLITRRLAGRTVPTDWSHALKTGYDLATEAWSPAVRAVLPPSLLPEVVRPGTMIGRVCPDGGAHTGLAPGTPILAGMTDGCAAQAATGALRPGDWSSVLGTTLVLKGVARTPILDPTGVLYCHRAPEGEWLPGGASSAGGGALGPGFPARDLDAVTREAMRHETTPVLAYPLVGRGERFPFCAPEAEGFVLGHPAEEAERFAALLQGLAFVERLCFDVLDLHGAPLAGELTLSGGASANRYLCQLRADVLGHPARLVEHGESAFGAAILAASGGHRLAEVAARMAATRERYQPDPARGARLGERYLDFVGELRRRDWIAPDVAAHATARVRAQPRLGRVYSTGTSRSSAGRSP